MEIVLGQIGDAVPERTVVDFDGLVRTKVIPGYKQMGREARAKAIQGAYESKRTWGGRVLLLDDILTTGSTGRECELVLRVSGAEEVMLLTLGRAQLDVGPLHEESEEADGGIG